MVRKHPSGEMLPYGSWFKILTVNRKPKRFTLCSCFLRDKSKFEKLAKERLAKLLAKQTTNPDGFHKGKTSLVELSADFQGSLKHTGLGNQDNIQRAFRNHLNNFLDGYKLDDIDRELVNIFRAHLWKQIEKGKITWQYANKLFSYFCQFIHWLIEEDYLSELPKNLIQTKNNRKKNSFTPRDHNNAPPVAIPLEDWAKIYRVAPPRLRCLMEIIALTGWTQKDLTDLKHEQIDWEKRTITRKRSKTQHMAGTPMVCYTFPVVDTWDPLMSWKPFMTNPKTHKTCFINTKGNPFSEHGINKRRDCLGKNFKYYRDKVGLKWTMRQIRKKSSMLLRNHPQYHLVYRLFLGHSAENLSETRYAGQGPTELLAQAIHYLWDAYMWSVHLIDHPEDAELQGHYDK